MRKIIYAILIGLVSNTAYAREYRGQYLSDYDLPLKGKYRIKNIKIVEKNCPHEDVSTEFMNVIQKLNNTKVTYPGGTKIFITGMKCKKAIGHNDVEDFYFGQVNCMINKKTIMFYGNMFEYNANDDGDYEFNLLLFKSWEGEWIQGRWKDGKEPFCRMEGTAVLEPLNKKKNKVKKKKDGVFGYDKMEDLSDVLK